MNAASSCRSATIQILAAAAIWLASTQLGCHHPSKPDPPQQTITPEDTTQGGSVGGHGSSVVLISASTSSIGVRHTGSNETARLVFEVRDDSGRPVDSFHRANVRFTLTQMPGGGAFLDPDTAVTDPSGRVAVHLNAGTLAQSVQVRARVAGSDTFSDVVRVAIHGGPPHAGHFSFASQTVNVPGLIEFGIVDRITAFVGDRYGNPVPAGNVVYFSTSGGIIQAAAATDDHGRATVELVTAEPLPNNLPAFSDSAGIARISVQTIGENQTPIIRSALAVAFTGNTEVAIEPSTFNIPLEGSQNFNVIVWDREHHNPLTKGTMITFTATAGTITGQSSIVLPDTWDRRYTRFGFSLENSPSGLLLIGPDRSKIPLRPQEISRARHGLAATASLLGYGGGSEIASRATVTVEVTSLNGNASMSVSGTIEMP